MILFLGFFGDFRGREPDLNCKFKLNFPLDDFGAENLTKIIKKNAKKKCEYGRVEQRSFEG